MAQRLFTSLAGAANVLAADVHAAVYGSTNRLGYWHTFSTWYSTADAVKSDLFIQSDKNLAAAAEGVFKLLGHACDAFSSGPYDAVAVSHHAGLVPIAPLGDAARARGAVVCPAKRRVGLGRRACRETWMVRRTQPAAGITIDGRQYGYGSFHGTRNFSSRAGGSPGRPCGTRASSSRSIHTFRLYSSSLHLLHLYCTGMLASCKSRVPSGPASMSGEKNPYNMHASCQSPLISIIQISAT